MDDPLIWVRGLHFAATVSVTGGVLFQTLVAEPALQENGRAAEIAALVRARVKWVIWFALALALLSGAAWLVLMAGQIAEMPWSDTISQGYVWTALQTDFGTDWLIRFALAVLLAAVLAGTSTKRAWRPAMAAIACALAASFVGSLAWAGHASATPGSTGVVHIIADVLHLVAAAAWIGALIPLAILLGVVHRRAEMLVGVVGAPVLRRFSTLGMTSVGTLVLTGIVNSWILVRSVSALVDTSYGRLLLVKLALFLGMLALAAANRLWLTPVVEGQDRAAMCQALRAIHRNSLLEAIAAALILLIVGWLGTLPPADENVHQASFSFISHQARE